MPDAPGLELIRGEIERDLPGAVLATSYEHGCAVFLADPAQIVGVLGWLKETPGQRYGFLASLHVADYLPAEPRFGVHYELLNFDRRERLRVKAMLADPVRADAEDPADPSLTLSAGSGEEHLPEIDSVTELFPTADAQERESYDFFGIVFRGHPNLTRILMPDDYVGWAQRRDFPVGGEPVTFTYNERNRG